MKWTYSIKNKYLASSLLFGLCLLVLFSNYLDRRHTKNVKNTIATLYDDRLIAEGYILKMTRNVYQIRELLNSDLFDSTKTKNISSLVDSINDSYNVYIITKLTETENTIALDFLNNLKGFEQNYSNNHNALWSYTEKALVSLSELSSIQLEESKLIMKIAESEYASIKASSQFVFAIVIIILLVLQALVFSSKTLIPLNKPKNPMLN